MIPLSSIIKLENIHKSFTVGGQDTPVLQDISLDIDAGSFVSVVGASGSGKSTLMHILGLLDVQSAGAYYFNQKNTHNLSSNALAKLRNQDIGFVFQNFSLLPAYPVWYNVLLPLYYRQQNVPLDKQLAITYLEKVGLAEYAEYYPNMLSGGQKQRVACARALIIEPKLILADEPTGALDSKTGAHILSLFTTLHAQYGVTIVMITHDKTVASQAARQIHLSDGKIISDTHHG